MALDKVCPAEPLSKDKFQTLLAAAWARTSSEVGNQSAMAGKMGLNDPKVIGRATGMKNLPEAHTIFNSLLAGPSALREVLAYYGVELCIIRPEAANDFATLSGLCEVAAELSEAIKDGQRLHPETLRIAGKLRPHMPALTAFLKEADGHRAPTLVKSA